MIDGEDWVWIVIIVLFLAGFIEHMVDGGRAHELEMKKAVACEETK